MSSIFGGTASFECVWLFARGDPKVRAFAIPKKSGSACTASHKIAQDRTTSHKIAQILPFTLCAAGCYWRNGHVELRPEPWLPGIFLIIASVSDEQNSILKLNLLAPVVTIKCNLLLRTSLCISIFCIE